MKASDAKVGHYYTAKRAPTYDERRWNIYFGSRNTIKQAGDLLSTSHEAASRLDKGAILECISATKTYGTVLRFWSNNTTPTNYYYRTTRHAWLDTIKDGPNTSRQQKIETVKAKIKDLEKKIKEARALILESGEQLETLKNKLTYYEEYETDESAVTALITQLKDLTPEEISERIKASGFEIKL